MEICFQTVKVYFEGGYQDTKIYLLDKLLAEQVVPGPAIIMDSLSTILVEPGKCIETFRILVFFYISCSY